MRVSSEISVKVSILDTSRPELYHIQWGDTSPGYGFFPSLWVSASRHLGRLVSRECVCDVCRAEPGRRGGTPKCSWRLQVASVCYTSFTLITLHIQSFFILIGMAEFARFYFSAFSSGGCLKKNLPNI